MTDWPGDPPEVIDGKIVIAGGAYPDTDPYAFNRNIVDHLKALYDLLTGDSLFAVDAKLKMGAGFSVEFWLGDAAGIEKLIVRDSAGAEVAAIDSDGNITLSGTIDGVDLAAHVLNADAHHAAITLGGGSDPALALAGQQLTLADVLTPAEHTAIGDAAPHHAAITLGGGSDPALALAGQQLTLADVLTPAEHTAIGDGAPHHAEAHTLASHTTKAHSELTDIGNDDHHVRYSDAEAIRWALILGG